MISEIKKFRYTCDKCGRTETVERDSHQSGYETAPTGWLIYIKKPEPFWDNGEQKILGAVKELYCPSCSKTLSL